MIIKEDDENSLAHYGILRRSGRYPWGSGSSEVTRSQDFFGYIEEMRAKGLSDTDIAEGLSTPQHPFNTTMLRNTTTLAGAARKAADVTQAQQLRDKGLSPSAIGRKMNRNESSVRALLAPGAADKINILNTTAAMLRDEVGDSHYLDIGKGVENNLNLSKEKLGTAVALLKDEGYRVHNVQVPTGPKTKTTVKVLTPPGTEYADVKGNMERIKTLTKQTDNGGRSFYGLLPPLVVNSSRIEVNYAEDGGGKSDGVMFVRPGVSDLSLKGSRYAQVRVNVDGTHYLKGMAVYKDNLPKGTDIVFNTNKKRAELGPDKLAAFKKQTDDLDNPFGSMVRQLGEHDAAGNLVKVTSALNIVNEEGRWSDWSRTLATQTLSKQNPSLVKQQLDVTYSRRKQEFDEIMALTNPVVKAKLLQTFSDATDASAVHMKAAALPRSSWHVILPVNSLKDHEIYAPNFRPGEQVALIRYPHGGTFEIPILTVNNQHPESIKLMGRAKDAVGINAKVAARLSGADFDGDAVLVIPNSHGDIRNQPALAGLKNFDPQTDYKPYDGMRTIDGGIYRAATRDVDYGPRKSGSPQGKGTQMGLVSNLITDMTIKGASSSELAAAVRHSMVVIDAEKHHLNYKQSSINNNIPHLMRKYQDGKSQGGSSTLISRAEGETQINRRKLRPMSKGGPIDKATGKLIYEDKPSYIHPVTGKNVQPKQSIKKLELADDAHTLSSGTKVETLYADHSNRLKAMANEARKQMVSQPKLEASPSAKKAYAAEVQSLNAKLDIALRNAPRERAARVWAETTSNAKLKANPDMDEAHKKRIRRQALDEGRRRFEAKKKQVEITPSEWNAIQNGAITHTKLQAILNNTDIQKVKELATPRATELMSSAVTSRARQMVANGYTQAEIADQLGVSLTTLKEGLK